MGGLLYKDFILVKGKLNVWIMVVLTVLFLVLRVQFPGTEDLKGFIVENDAGEMVNILDTFFLMAETTMLLAGFLFINAWCSKIVMSDEKNKIRGYLSSMPFNKRSYVASKYIFIGITAYVILSVYLVWHVIDLAFMRPGHMMEVSYLGAGFSLTLISLMLFVAALELPLYFLLGKGKARLVEISFMMFLGLLALGFLMFGDMNLLANIDIGVLIDWANAHEFELMLLSTLSPVIVVLIYYASYRVTAHFYLRKEEANE